jgi:hypothetical protein
MFSETLDRNSATRCKVSENVHNGTSLLEILLVSEKTVGYSKKTTKLLSRSTDHV